MSEEIVVYSQPGGLARRNPRAVLAEASEAAVALKEVIDARPKKLVLGGETYLQIEDWCTVGHFFNYVPSLVEDRFVEYGGAQGWEATAAVRRISDGIEISRATAMCLNDEENWSDRPSYEWHYVTKTMGTVKDDPGRDEIIWEPGQNGKNRPKKIKVQVGEEPVPQHQLRSMAQTRANAKALSNVLRFVPVLAGYKGTPAEEMSGRWEEDRSEGASQGAASPAGAPPPTQEPRQRKQRAKGKDDAPPPPAESQEGPAPAEFKPVDDRMTVKPQRTREEWQALHRAAEASGLDEKSVAEHMKLLYPGRNYNQLSDQEASDFLLWAQGNRPATGYKADHFVSPDRLATPPGVKSAAPATVGEVLARHGIGQAPPEGAMAQVSDEVARQVRNLEKWAVNAGRSLDHVRGASMAAFGAGLEATLARFGKVAYTVLMDWTAEDDPAVDRDKVLERAALDVKEGRPLA